MKGSRGIEKRKRLFLGCEGESEQAYGTLLNRLANANGPTIHIVAINLQPAGDSLALAEKAVSAYQREVRKGGFAAKAILLDADKRDDLPEKGRRAQALLTKQGFTAIWQRPSHEGLLLRHFPGQEYVNPSRDQVMRAICSQWPGYRKNMAAAELQKMLTLEHIRRA
jgi:hypothetical protein